MNIKPTNLIPESKNYITISTKTNQGCRYLYNSVIDILSKHREPALFSNEKIEIYAPRDSVNISKIITALNSKRIKFDRIV